MVKHIEGGVFKNNSKRSEAKSDPTTTAVRTINRNEAAAREAKTARLRAARLALPAAPAEPPKTERSLKK